MTAVGPGMLWVKQVDRVTSRPARPSGISVATMSQASARRRIVVVSSHLVWCLPRSSMIWVGHPSVSGRAGSI